MENTFFATLFRMKYISRWGLMRCNFPENLAEHSLEVAFRAHALALIGNRVVGKSYDCGAVCVKAKMCIRDRDPAARSDRRPQV